MRVLPEADVLALYDRWLDLGNISMAHRQNSSAFPTRTSLYPIPDGADEEALVMLSDILPTGFECGVLNGKVQPGSIVAIVGSGPIGLAALLTAHSIRRPRSS